MCFPDPDLKQTFVTVFCTQTSAPWDPRKKEQLVSMENKTLVNFSNRKYKNCSQFLEPRIEGVGEGERISFEGAAKGSKKGMTADYNSYTNSFSYLKFSPLTSVCIYEILFRTCSSSLIKFLLI